MDADSRDAGGDAVAADAGLVSPTCGGNNMVTSSIADRNLTSPGWRQPTAVVETLGRGWTGTVSFHMITYGCSDLYNTVHFTDWRITDGTGNVLDTGSGPSNQSYQSLTLPVAIAAAGVQDEADFPNHICTASAMQSQIGFDLAGTSCITQAPLRQQFGTGPNDWAAIIGNDMMHTKMTFSAQVQFYANYTAPECGRISFYGRTNGVTLTPSSPVAQLIELESPIYVDKRPSCVSSRLASPEAADADFVLTFSPIALGTPE